MVNRLVTPALSICLLCLAVSVNAADFSIEDLKNASTENSDAFSSSSQRLKSLQNQGLEVLDHSTVIYELQGRTFPGYVLPNGVIVPAIINNLSGARKPACLDKYFQRHPAKYEPSTGKITCQIRSADLLDVVDVQKSVGNKSVRKMPGAEVPDADEPEIEEPNTVEPVTVSKHGVTSNNQEEPLKPEPDPAPSKKESPSANKHGNLEKDDKPTKKAAKPKADSIPDDWYLPPVRTAGQSNSSGFTLSDDSKINFGVTKGTWVKAEIRRRVRSSDRGEIEIYTLETIYGDKKTIPAGSRLFASPSFNSGSSRLDLVVTNFIYEDENESMQAAVYDRSKEFGIAGKLLRNRESEFASAGSEAILTTVGSAIGQVPFAGDPLSEGAESMTDSIVGYESNYLPEAQQAVVEVPPQIVYLQIMVSF